MIPKVIIWQSDDREKLLEKLSVRSEELISVDGEKINVEDFRHWVNESIGIVQSRPNYRLIIWMAESLSWECQAVLLKPLEELGDDLTFYLIVKNESGLMATILSRCTIEKHENDSVVESSGYWEKVLACWKEGPSKCIELSDSMDKESAAKMINELTQKLNKNLTTGVSEKRLHVLDEVLKFSEDIKNRNINIKLCTGDFLLRTWKLIKTPISN